MSEDFKKPERTKRYDPAADPDGKTMVGFKVVQKQYSQIRAIFAELGQSDTLLLRALKEGHGITFNSLTENPMLFFVVSQDQVEALKKNGVPAPTFLQLLGTCEVIARSEAQAVARFKALKENQ